MSEGDYVIRRSSRAKRMRITIDRAGVVTLVIPRWVPEVVGKAFVYQKSEWIKAQQKEQKLQKAWKPLTAAQREKARAYLTKRTEFWADLLGVGFNQIRIKDTQTRWGSCSAKGNLNYSARIMGAPKEVIDYLVIHEVCHLKEMNHSPRFWALVQSLDPDYKAHEKWLKDHGRDLR